MEDEIAACLETKGLSYDAFNRAWMRARAKLGKRWKGINLAVDWGGVLIAALVVIALGGLLFLGTETNFWFSLLVVYLLIGALILRAWPNMWLKHLWRQKGTVPERVERMFAAADRSLFQRLLPMSGVLLIPALVLLAVALFKLRTA